MASVELARAAVADLDRLIRTHSLPRGTRQRVRESLEPLGRFPRLGPELTGRWRMRDNIAARDALYVAAARDLGCELLTTDQRLARAVPDLATECNR